MGGISSSVGAISGIDTGRLIEQLLAVESRPRVQFQSRILQLQGQQGAFLDLNSKLTAVKNALEGIRTSNTFQKKTASSSDEDVMTATATVDAAPGNYSFLVDRLVTSQQNLSRGFVDRSATAVGMTSVTFEPGKARLDADTNLADLNDGEGIARGKIQVTDGAGRSATVDLSRAITVQDVLNAINSNGTATVEASVRDGRFVIRDTSGSPSATAPTVANSQGSTTAASLGLTTASSATGTTRSGALVYGLNRNTAIRSLNDGNGVAIKSTTTSNDYQFTIAINDAGTVSNVRVNLGDVWSGTTKTAGAVSTMGQTVDRINEALSCEWSGGAERLDGHTDDRSHGERWRDHGV
jgi:flagellar hook-associated protein 2